METIGNRLFDINTEILPIQDELNIKIENLCKEIEDNYNLKVLRLSIDRNFFIDGSGKVFSKIGI